MRGTDFRILEINLTDRESRIFQVPSDQQRDYLGGASLAARILFESITPELDPLSPEAPLCILTGPLTGTTGPAVGRFVICAKSPATGLWGESNVGGFFGPELRAAGFDGLLLRGKSERPIYLYISEAGVSYHDAAHLWGQQDTYGTQRAVLGELQEPRARVASIGVAGERLIPFALVLCDHGRVAGRTGMGAVMGSKNLKAVAVRGSGKIPLADPQGFAELRRKANVEMRDDSVTTALRDLGTGSGGDYFDYLGEMPKRYFTKGEFSGAAKVSGAHMAETILSGVSTCHGCVIACGRVVKLDKEGERKGPEYETMVGFGPNLLIDDLSTVTKLGEMCDRYGVDTISASNIIGLAFHLADLDAYSPADFDMPAPGWGDPEVVERYLRQMVEGDGFGEILAQGARVMGEEFNMPEEACQVNGLEIAYHDPRGSSGMALVYATSPRGACHNQSDYFMVDMGQSIEEIGVDFYPRQAGAEKAASVAAHQNWRTLGNSLVICVFANVPPETLRDLVRTATGRDYSLADLLRSGERGWNLKRLININLGLTASDDRLPGILLREFQEGGSAGYTVPFDEMIEAYYRARRWDQATGVPSRELLEDLEMREFKGSP